MPTMPIAKDRGFLVGMESWTSRNATPKPAHTALVTMARRFEQLDRVMLYEMRDDIARSRLSDGELTSRFDDSQDQKDTRVEEIN